MLLAWSAFAAYVVVTLYLAWLGQRKTTTLESYAVGNRDMHPVVVGMALAASMTSTATFIINPGIVYAYGLSAVLGYGLSAGLGLTLGIVVLSKGFRRHGETTRALTVPQWIGRRYGDRRLTAFYALVNLLLLAMVVLICYAMASLLAATLRLDALLPELAFEAALAFTVLFVFAYIFFGGTYAHAYTNTLQGFLMVLVAVALVGSGLPLLGGGVLERLASVDPDLARAVNPDSLLFRNLFEVFGANFVVGFALAVQPHFLIKALYVKTERQVNQYLGVAVAAGVLFNLVLLCGLYARVSASEFVTEFIARQGTGIDGVMPAYILHTFSPAVGVLISIALVAAGMSTLDGILVALSAIVANDLFLNVRALARERGTGGGQSEKAAHSGPEPGTPSGEKASDPESSSGEEHSSVEARPGQEVSSADVALAFRVGRWSLVVFGVLAFGLSLAQHHFKELSVAIFAQQGVYALFAATCVPVLFGAFRRPLPKGVVLTASLVALAVHFGFRWGELTLLTPADWTNPAMTSVYGLFASVGVVGLWALARRLPGR